MANALYSKPRLADFILSEASGQRSRENVVVTQAGGLAIPSGTVLGELASGKYVPYLAAGTGGAEVAVAVLYNALPALSATGDTRAVAFVRDCEVKESALTGFDADARTDFAAVGIVVRTGGDLGVKTKAL